MAKYVSPRAMHAGGRPVDHEFAPEEQLYRRFPLRQYRGGKIGMDTIQGVDLSVNRSKYGGLPVYALLYGGKVPFYGWGVFQFRVDAIPPAPIHPDHRTWRLEARHVPREQNYYHSEMQFFDEKKHVQNERAIPPQVLLLARRAIHKKSLITIDPKHSRAQIKATLAKG